MSVKISELPILDSLADNDIVAGVDVSGNVTSKIEMATLKNYIDTNTQYTAGTNIDITNNVVSAPNVYNKNETDELLEEKDEQIEELQSEVDSLSTIFNAFPTESGEGESLTLDDTAEVKFKKFDLKGNTSQTTYSGKNLLNLPNGSKTSNGITSTITNGKLKIVGTTTANWFSICSLNIPLESGTYTFSYTNKKVFRYNLALRYEDNTTGTIYGNTDRNTLITLNQKATIIAMSSDSNTVGATFDYEDYLMLEAGSSATSYEPFVGGTASPNPSYPQPVNVVSGDNEIEVCGKNLFDNQYYINNKSKFVNAYQGFFYAIELNNMFKNEITISMAVSGTSQSGLVLALTDSIGSSPGNASRVLTSDGTITTRTFDFSNSDHVYLQIGAATKATALNTGINAIMDNYNIQVEINSSSTTYEPYQGNTYNIDLPVENKLPNLTTSFNTTSNGVTKKGENGTYRVYGTATGTDYAVNNALVNNYTIKSGDYLHLCNNIAIANIAIVFFTTNGQFDYSPNAINRVIDLSSYIGKTITGVGFYTNASFNGDVTLTPMILQTNKQNSYTPYGTTPIELCKIGNYQDYFDKSDGRNLFDKNNETYTSAYITGSGVTTLSASNYNRTLYIPCQPNTTYTIQKMVSVSASRFFIASSVDIPSVGVSIYNVLNGGDNNTSAIYTTSNNAKYLLVNYMATNQTTTSVEEMLSSIQIEKGSSASDYQPYGVGKWYLHKEIGKVVFNDTSVTSISTYWLQSKGVYGAATSKSTLGLPNNYLDVPSLCTSAHHEHRNWVVNNNDYNFTVNDHEIFFFNDSWDTKEKANTALNGAILYYALPTPTGEEITYQPLIDQLNELEKAMSKEGQTNISQVSNDKPFILDVTAIKSLQNVLDRIELLES